MRAMQQSIAVDPINPGESSLATVIVAGSIILAQSAKVCEYLKSKQNKKTASQQDDRHLKVFLIAIIIPLLKTNAISEELACRLYQYLHL